MMLTSKLTKTTLLFHRDLKVMMVPLVAMDLLAPR